MSETDYEILRAMPKVELHCHLDGALHGNLLDFQPIVLNLDEVTIAKRVMKPSRHLHGLIEIIGLYRIVSAKLLLRFGERAIGDHGLSVSDPDGRRVRGGLERLAAQHFPRAL